MSAGGSALFRVDFRRFCLIFKSCVEGAYSVDRF